MGRLTIGSAAKLEKILSKRMGRKLSQEELEEAYDALMEFAFALVDLDSIELQDQKQSPHLIKNYLLQTAPYILYSVK